MAYYDSNSSETNQNEQTPVSDSYSAGKGIEKTANKMKGNSDNGAYSAPKMENAASDLGEQSLGEAGKQATENLGKEAAKEVGKESINAGTDAALAGASTAAAAPTMGASAAAGVAAKVGTEVADKTIGNITRAIQKGTNKDKDYAVGVMKIGVIVGIIVIVPLLIILFLLLSLPSLILQPLTNPVQTATDTTTGPGIKDYLYELGHAVRLVSDDKYNAVETNRILSDNGLTESENTYSMTAAIYKDVFKESLETALDGLKIDLKAYCATETEEHVKYNYILTAKTLEGQNPYGNINYAEMICVASENPELALESTGYLKLKNYINNADKLRNLYEYEVTEKEIQLTVPEIIENGMENDVSGLVGRAVTCYITYTPNKKAKALCSVSKCYVSGIKYTSHHSSGDEDPKVLSGFFCSKHAPQNTSHVINDEGNEEELQNEIREYKESGTCSDAVYTFKYAEITLYPYSLTSLYKTFDLEANGSHYVYNDISNYEMLDFKEELLRTYANDINLGSTDRTQLGSFCNYTGSIDTGDIFQGDIVFENGGTNLTFPEGGYYNQGNSKWANYRYWEKNTIRSSGCCLCSIAMIANYFSTDSVTPITIATAGSPMMSSDYKVSRTAVAQNYGFSTIVSNENYSAQKVMDELDLGHPVIVHFVIGEFTKKGHYAVIKGYMYDANNNPIFIMYDPGSKVRTESGISFAKMAVNADKIWSYGKD